MEHYGDDDLVLVLLGDHQPANIVSGQDADHDVPITVVTRDRSVLDRISGWGWQGGHEPVAATRRSGGWTPSATASSRRSARETPD